MSPIPYKISRSCRQRFLRLQGGGPVLVKGVGTKRFDKGRVNYFYLKHPRSFSHNVVNITSPDGIHMCNSKCQK